MSVRPLRCSSSTRCRFVPQRSFQVVRSLEGLEQGAMLTAGQTGGVGTRVLGAGTEAYKQPGLGFIFVNTEN